MKIGFIGTGNMGSALAGAVAKSDIKTQILLADFDTKKALALAQRLGGEVKDNLKLIEECDFVFLGVKPQVLPALLCEIAPAVKKREGSLTLVTMAAGVKIDSLLSVLGENTPVIRIMPNTPVAVGKGVVAYCTANVSEEKEKAFVASLAKAGLVEKIDEGKIDAASALHGCGPAFVYLFIEALSDGAVLCGLPREQALRLAAMTAQGAAQMVLESGEHPGILKDRVCSPGGSTIEGVKKLEEMGLRAAAMDAVAASYKRTLELGK